MQIGRVSFSVQRGVLLKKNEQELCYWDSEIKCLLLWNRDNQMALQADGETCMVLG